MTKPKILALNGINLNMFGQRDSSHYGTKTLEDINNELKNLAKELNVEIENYQTNHEGQMCEKIHEAHFQKINGVLINAGAWTHTSVAIRDALLILKCPIIEVHMSNIHAREEFRHKSYIADIALGQIAGFGINSYLLALRALVYKINER